MPVAVVIPVRDRAQLLPRALDSVLAQTLKPDEIVVVDDGSEDGADLLVEERYPAVRLASQRARGVSAARNRGIAETSAEWLAFLDSDDEWLPEKLQAQLESVRVSGRRLCHCDEIWVRDGRRVNPRRHHRKRGGDIFLDCLERCVISPSAALVHRSLFADLGTFDETLPACEDYDLWLRICSREPVEFVARKLVVKYGGHPDQLSRRFWGLDRFRVQALGRLLESGGLAGSEREAARTVLQQKLRILIAGARKRGREDRAAAWEEMRQRFEGLADV